MTDRRCIVCARAELEPTQPQTCDRCVARTRSRLVEIETLYALLPQAVTIRAGAARPLDSPGGADRTAIPGGDAMVLMGPGSTRWHTAFVDVDSVPGLLERWEADWRTTMGLRAARTPATVTGCALFLHRNLDRMADQHPAFDEFHSDLERTTGQLRAATGHGHVVDRGLRVPCEHCDDPLIRCYRDPRPCEHRGPHCDHSHPDRGKWSCRGSNTCACDQGGRADDWECAGCGAVVDEATYWLRVMERQQQAC